MLCVVNVCPIHAVDLNLIDPAWVVIVPGQKCIKKKKERCCYAQKSKLKIYILNKAQPTQQRVSTKIMNAGALLWCCDWKKNEQSHVIFEKYTSLEVDIVVFDGHSMSTKDATHQKRSGTVTQTLETHDQYHCPSERNVFLSNYTNKENFVMALATKLELDGFEVVLCPCDADTTIVKVALDSANGTPVTVYSDDTDVLCLLVHHVKVPTNPPDIFLTSMTTAKNSPRLCYRIEDLICELDDMVCSTYCSVTCSQAVTQLQQFTDLVKTSIFVEIR